MSYEADRFDPYFAPGPAQQSLNDLAVGADYPSRAHMRRVRSRRDLFLRRSLPMAIALMAVLMFVILTNGGRVARETSPITSYVGTLLNRLGLGLNEVTVSGQRMTADRDIYDRLQLAKQNSVWLIDIEQARRRVETLSWVEQASLQRVFPDRLHVDIKERTPRAIWSDGHNSMLIDRTGRVLGPLGASKSSALPIMFGVDAPKHADAVLNAIAAFPDLQNKVAVFEWTARRRWTLHLRNGQKILLPAQGWTTALLQLVKGKAPRRLIDADFRTLDMRIASQTAIKFQE